MKKMNDRKYNYRSSEINNFIKTLFRKIEIEHFMIINLTKEYKVRAAHIIKVGPLVNSEIQVGEWFRLALNTSTESVAFAHILPSGKPELSAIDKRMAERLKQGGDVLGIEVADYLVIADKDYFSFQDKNLL